MRGEYPPLTRIQVELAYHEAMTRPMGPEPARRERKKFRDWHLEVKRRAEYAQEIERKDEERESVRQEIANQPPFSTYEPGKLRVVYFGYSESSVEST